MFAKLHGAEVIVSTVPDKFDRVRALGADHVVDRNRDDWLDSIYALTGDRGADHILETVGGAHFGASVEAAAIGGHIYQIGALAGFDIATPVMPLMMKDVTIHGIATGRRRALEDMVRAIDRSRATPVIVNKHRAMIPVTSTKTILYRADRHPDPMPVHTVETRAKRHSANS